MKPCSDRRSVSVSVCVCDRQNRYRSGTCILSPPRGETSPISQHSVSRVLVTLKHEVPLSEEEFILVHNDGSSLSVAIKRLKAFTAHELYSYKDINDCVLTWIKP